MCSCAVGLNLIQSTRSISLPWRPPPPPPLPSPSSPAGAPRCRPAARIPSAASPSTPAPPSTAATAPRAATSPSSPPPSTAGAAPTPPPLSCASTRCAAPASARSATSRRPAPTSSGPTTPPTRSTRSSSATSLASSPCLPKGRGGGWCHTSTPPGCSPRGTSAASTSTSSTSTPSAARPSTSGRPSWRSRLVAFSTSPPPIGGRPEVMAENGGAAREAAMLGFHIKPVFSYYAYHGPIFRAMVQLCHGKEDGISNYGFICHCKSCGQSQTFGFDELGQISCGCADKTDATSITVVGPLWTGPLHDRSSITEMLNLAVEWGWARTSENGITLEKLLATMSEESDPRLPPGYIRLDEIASRAKVNSPPLGTLIHSLQKEGYAACRSHIGANAVKTNCPISSCIVVAREIRNFR